MREERAPRGTLGGLLAAVGRLALQLVLLVWVIQTAQMVAFWWSGPIYSLAFGMGMCQLVVMLWGNTRYLRGVRFDKSLEYPPDLAGGER